MQKILVALSGGVDSAAAAALLQEQGFRVGAGTMLLCPGGGREAEDAEAAARRLGLPFHLFRWEEDFRRAVIEPFAAVYQAGGTPAPCVLCNKTMKFGKFLEAALALGYDGVATGHYARIERAGGRFLLKTALDAARDQSYMLAGLTQSQLSHVLLPLGELTKAEARAVAARRGLLEQQGKKDSQDICFVPDGDYFGYLRAHGLRPQAGRFRTAAGEDLGPHRGYEAYTVGQRRGLGISLGRRLYVLSKPRPDVVLGDEAELYAKGATLADLNWIGWDRPPERSRALVKLRYTARPVACTVAVAGTGAELVFDERQRAVTPGQAAVLYDGEAVLGMGTIVSSNVKFL